ncbi:hypothetical protein ABZX50_33595 [Streptomyces misionensis]
MRSPGGTLDFVHDAAGRETARHIGAEVALTQAGVGREGCSRRHCQREWKPPPTASCSTVPTPTEPTVTSPPTEPTVTSPRSAS